MGEEGVSLFNWFLSTYEQALISHDKIPLQILVGMTNLMGAWLSDCKPAVDVFLGSPVRVASIMDVAGGNTDKVW